VRIGAGAARLGGGAAPPRTMSPSPELDRETLAAKRCAYQFDREVFHRNHHGNSRTVHHSIHNMLWFRKLPDYKFWC